MSARWQLEIRRTGAWRLLDQFHDRDSACKALGAVLRDYEGEDVRLRRERADANASENPAETAKSDANASPLTTDQVLDELEQRMRRLEADHAT